MPHADRIFISADPHLGQALHPIITMNQLLFYIHGNKAALWLLVLHLLKSSFTHPGSLMCIKRYFDRGNGPLACTIRNRNATYGILYIYIKLYICQLVYLGNMLFLSVFPGILNIKQELFRCTIPVKLLYLK